MSGAISATTLAVVGGITAAGGVASSVIGANAAGKAADAQAGAAQNAQALQAKEAQDALDFNKQQYANTQKNEAPYLGAGQTALDQLSKGTAPGGSLVTPYQGFTAPTGLDIQNDPGYQARLALGTDTLQKSAAARGSVLTGATGKALDSYAQDYASNEYGNVYNRALNTYGTNASNYYTGQGNTFNRLNSLATMGQNTAVSQGNQGQAAANNNANIDLTTGAQQGQDLQNAGTATASGYVGGANAINSGISGVTSGLSNLALLSQLSKSGYSNNVYPKTGYEQG
jgi:hypothetical protein